MHAVALRICASHSHHALVQGYTLVASHKTMMADWLLLCSTGEVLGMERLLYHGDRHLYATECRVVQWHLCQTARASKKSQCQPGVSEQALTPVCQRV